MPHLIKPEPSDPFLPGGLFLDADTVPITSFISLISSSSNTCSNNPGRISCFSWGPRRRVGFEIFRVAGRFSGGVSGGGFLSLSLSINGTEGDQRYARESEPAVILEQHEEEVSEEKAERGRCQEKENAGVSGSGAMNMTKHLWAGAVAAMVSRS